MNTDLYRAEYFITRRWNDLSIVDVKIVTYSLAKKTPKGGWYERVDFPSERKWVADKGRKRHAYPTKREAVESLLRRKEIHVNSLKQQLFEMEKVKEIAYKMSLDF